MVAVIQCFFNHRLGESKNNSGESILTNTLGKRERELVFMNRSKVAAAYLVRESVLYWLALVVVPFLACIYVLNKKS